jgi:hypothetical protein
MQANRQNTRQLAAGASEIMEWFTQGAEWSILNYGPGTLWFSYTPGVDAAPGEVQATKLEAGYSFTDSASAPRALQLSLMAEGTGLTYCLNTNQRYGAGTLPPGGGIGEAPEDGELYGRRSAAWDRVPPGIPEAPGTGPSATLTHGRRGGDEAWVAVVNKSGDSMTGNLVMDSAHVLLDNGRVEVVRPAGPANFYNQQHLLLIHAAKGMNQSPTPGTVAIVFMNNNEVQNGGFHIGKIALNDFADELMFQAGTSETPIDIRARNLTLDAGGPSSPLHATTKFYVDALAAAGPIQTIPVTGAGWSAAQTLNYRLLHGGAVLQITGFLNRMTAIPPGVAGQVNLCQFPPGFRPVIGNQIQICAAVAGVGVDSAPEQVIEYGFLSLDVTGSLSFYGHAPLDSAATPPLQGTMGVYISNIFGLTMGGTGLERLL